MNEVNTIVQIASISLLAYSSSLWLIDANTFKVRALLGPFIEGRHGSGPAILKILIRISPLCKCGFNLLNLIFSSKDMFPRCGFLKAAVACHET